VGRLRAGGAAIATVVATAASACLRHIPRALRIASSAAGTSPNAELLAHVVRCHAVEERIGHCVWRTRVAFPAARRHASEGPEAATGA